MDDSLIELHSYSGTRGDHSVRVQIKRNSGSHEYVLEHSDDLKSKNILATVVANFEDGLLPNLKPLDGLSIAIYDVDVIVQNGVDVLLDDEPFFANFEGGHERGLRGRNISNGHLRTENIVAGTLA
jgi:hypothetical protein